MNSKRIISLLLCALLLVPMLICAAFAIDLIDKDAEVSLTVNYSDSGIPIPNAEFDVYYVASTSKASEFTVSAEFEGAGIDLSTPDEEFWKEVTPKLAEYAQSENLSPTATGVTGESGKALFSGIPQGLYLGIGHSVEYKGTIYNSLPFLICVPNREDNSESWTYDVTVNPKPGDIITPTPAPTPTPDPTLPQTGELWWPVPILLVVGLALIVAGIAVRKGNRHGRKES